MITNMIHSLVFFLSLHHSCGQIRFPEEPINRGIDKRNQQPINKGNTSSLTVLVPRLEALLQSIEDEAVEKVYNLTDDGFIECTLDSDCPPTTPPVWDELTKMEDHGVTSITELSIEVSFCFGKSFFGSVCDIRREPFCAHELGREHPECERCNAQSPPSDPPCKFLVEGRPSIGRRPYSVSAVSGTGSLLSPRGLTRKASSCPFGHCKRPSLAIAGRLICCLLIRSKWGNARVPVCPNSCDLPSEQEQRPIWT